jgi:aldose 1-epimerase
MKRSVLLAGAGAIAMLAGLTACNNTKTKEMISSEPFGTFNQKEVLLFTLKNSNGNTLKLTNFGATIVYLEVPDRDGVRENVTFGYETLDGYLNGDPYFGSVVGRFANRIGKGKFTLDGTEYTLALNNGPNTLHGGPGGWHSVVWDAEVLKETNSVKFTYNSPDMEEGYPGNMVAEVVYTWTDKDEVIMDYTVTTDKKSVINITNHAYFNLHGAGKADILDHELTIHAAAFTPVDSTLIPTGEIRAVAGTPFDFTTPRQVGERIDEQDEQLILGGGYDHNFVLDNTGEVDAVVYDNISGRVLEVITDLPGVQFYCGNFLDGTQTGHGGYKYEYRSGLCLETQFFPDSPNKPEFPSSVINPGDTFKTRTIYRFSVK